MRKLVALSVARVRHILEILLNLLGSVQVITAIKKDTLLTKN